MRNLSSVHVSGTSIVHHQELHRIDTTIGT